MQQSIFIYKPFNLRFHRGFYQLSSVVAKHFVTLHDNFRYSLPAKHSLKQYQDGGGFL